MKNIALALLTTSAIAGFATNGFANTRNIYLGSPTNTVVIEQELNGGRGNLIDILLATGTNNNITFRQLFNSDPLSNYEGYNNQTWLRGYLESFNNTVDPSNSVIKSIIAGTPFDNNNRSEFEIGGKVNATHTIYGDRNILQSKTISGIGAYDLTDIYSIFYPTISGGSQNMYQAANGTYNRLTALTGIKSGYGVIEQIAGTNNSGRLGNTPYKETAVTGNILTSVQAYSNGDTYIKALGHYSTVNTEQVNVDIAPPSGLKSLLKIISKGYDTITAKQRNLDNSSLTINADGGNNITATQDDPLKRGFVDLSRGFANQMDITSTAGSNTTTATQTSVQGGVLNSIPIDTTSNNRMNIKQSGSSNSFTSDMVGSMNNLNWDSNKANYDAIISGFDFAGAFQVTPAGQTNTGQRGNNNSITTRQTGYSNLSYVNESETERFNRIKLAQEGWQNTINSTQSGASNAAVIWQAKDNNRATTIQIGTLSARSSTSILQNGYDNLAHTGQNSYALSPLFLTGIQKADISQKGDLNQATLTNDGELNTQQAVQNGNLNVVNQQTVRGLKNYLTSWQVGTSNKILFVSQVSAESDRYGDGNNNNSLNLLQEGIGNLITSVEQYGKSNGVNGVDDTTHARKLAVGPVGSTDIFNIGEGDSINPSDVSPETAGTSAGVRRQFGNGNSLTVKQGSYTLAVSGNNINQRQKGNNNYMTFEQMGNNNLLNGWQIGNSNNIKAYQWGNDNKSYATQNGSGNLAYLVEQANNNVMTAKQKGNGNQTYLHSTGNANQFETTQIGDSNYINGYALNANKKTTITQIGVGHRVNLDQPNTSTNNQLTATQSGGDGNYLNMYQWGNDNTANTIQDGSYNLSYVVSQGNAHKVTTNQKGIYNQTFIHSVGQANEYDTTQTGDYNYIADYAFNANQKTTIAQIGWGNRASISQPNTSTNNKVEIYQLGNSSTADLQQLGTGNAATIYQKNSQYVKAVQSGAGNSLNTGALTFDVYGQMLALQKGNNNAMDLTLNSGNRSQMRGLQRGDGNYMKLTGEGSGNRIAAEQIGSNNSMNLRYVGDRNTITYKQIGNGLSNGRQFTSPVTLTANDRNLKITQTSAAIPAGVAHAVGEWDANWNAQAPLTQ